MADVDCMQINMLGEFSLSYGGRVISGQNSRSKKVWTLLEYLITFRDREISQNELIELLWADDDIDNPANTLKTLLHRVRNVVSELGYAGGKEIIIYRRGTYFWNPEIPIVVDADEFECLINTAAATEDIDRKLELMLQALHIYKGDFLPQSALEHWAMPIVTYYHSQYTKLAHDTIDLLAANARFDDVLTVCQDAVAIDPYDEGLHYSMIQALVATGAQQAALAHYDYVTELFFNQFGITPSPELTALYKDIVKTSKSMELDLNIIKEGLRERELEPGAFFCEYEFFKDIYRLMARSASRTGQVVHIALLTLSAGNRSKLSQKLLNTSMERLKEIVQTSLRRGDVFSRYSVSQYLLLLPSASYENGDLVMRRVVQAFKRKWPKMDVSLSYKLLPLDPIM